MGKNKKVLLDNGKEASSSMQLYWNKAKQIQKKKQEVRKQDMKEKRASETQQRSGNQNQGDDDEVDNKAFMSKEAMSNIMKEKERRRQGQYSSNSGDVISEANIINAQKAMANKSIKIPGYSTEFISSQQIERNKREMEQRKVIAQAARDRKEMREQQEKEGGNPQAQKPPQQDQQKGQQPPLPPHLANKPPHNPQKQFQQRPPYQNQHHHFKPKDQSQNDPFFKVTDQENYDPVQERIKQLQKAQQQQAESQQNSQLPPPPPNMPPPPMVPGQMPFYPPSQTYYPNQQMPQQIFNAPAPIVPQPVVVEGESTVKKSKIDLTQKKQQFIPRSVIAAQITGKPANESERQQVKQPEALGGNIQNVSQAPAPKPFLSTAGVNPFVSNSSNQDLLKAFLSDIESISKMSNTNQTE